VSPQLDAPVKLKPVNSKKTQTGLATLLLILLLATTGCTDADLANFSISGIQNSTGQPPISSPAAVPNEALSGIIGQVTQIMSIKYDMVTSAPELPSIATKVLLKKNRMRMEMSMQGTNTVILVDPAKQAIYFYLPGMNIAMKMDWNQIPDSAITDVLSILKNQPIIDGTESIDGKDCLIVKYSIGSETSIIWIWQQNGLPIKMISPTSSGQMTVEFKNYDFSDIPDNLFDLPANVTISTLGVPPGVMPLSPPVSLPANPPVNFPTKLPNIY
jgi:hypothetical protein